MAAAEVAMGATCGGVHEAVVGLFELLALKFLRGREGGNASFRLDALQLRIRLDELQLRIKVRV